MILMVCPKGNSLGLGFQTDYLGGWHVILAFLISETNLMTSMFVSSLYKKYKHLSFWQHLIWNLIIFILFIFAFLTLIISVRIGLYLY